LIATTLYNKRFNNDSCPPTKKSNSKAEAFTNPGIFITHRTSKQEIGQEVKVFTEWQDTLAVRLLRRACIGRHRDDASFLPRRVSTPFPVAGTSQRFSATQEYLKVETKWRCGVCKISNAAIPAPQRDSVPFADVSARARRQSMAAAGSEGAQALR
jgi:hypothetical protein